ncbi:hypothetical protein ACRAKI_00320 [Saccharothrix isguenensis]
MKPASVIIVLVLLSAVTVGAWVARPDGPQAAPTTAAADPTPRLPYVEPLPDPLVTPPNPLVFELEAAPAKFLGSGVLTDPEVKLLADHGVVRITSRITRDAEGTTMGVWRFTARADPRPALAAIDRLYEQGGHELRPTNHQGLLMRHRDGVFHGHYVRGDDVFRVEGYGPGGTSAITELTDRQLALSPAEAR